MKMLILVQKNAQNDKQNLIVLNNYRFPHKNFDAFIFP